MILSLNEWFQTLIRQFFYNLDNVVFNLIPTIYDFLIELARTSIFTQADILDMADRIYKLLAVFMVFKVTFSLIMYVVNPDDFSDKSKGISKISTNIVISLALLILTPYVFRYAYQLQTYILEDNSLATLILGNKSGDTNSFFNSAGEEMAYIMINPFFTPDSSIDDIYECTQLTAKYSSDVKFNEACSGISNDTYEAKSPKTGLYKLVNPDSDFSMTMLQNYVAGINNKNFGLTFRQDLATVTVKGKNGENIYLMDYKYLISTAVGIITLLLLVTFCMDVALRSVKLAFLQLIAPIPIISYIDPKSGKDGLFKKWYKMCFKTFLSLFVRLLALYFAVYLISRVDYLTDIIDGSYKTAPFLKIFVVIGGLMFAKQLPKILEGLGIKLDGDGKFTLNPFKKFENEAIGGKKILGAAKGLAAGTMVGAAGMFTGAGLGRGMAAMAGGVKSGIQGKKIGEIRKDQVTRNAEMRRARASGSSFWERRGAQLSGYFGTPGRLGRIEHDKLDAQNKLDNLEASKKMVQARIAPKQNIIAKKQQVKTNIEAMESFIESQITGNKAGTISDKYRTLKANHQYLQNNVGEEAKFDVKDVNGKVIVTAGQTITAEHVSKADNEVGFYLKKQGKGELMNQYLNHAGGLDKGAQQIFDAKRSAYEKSVETYNNVETDSSQKLEVLDNYKELHEDIDHIDTSVMNKQLEISEDSAEIERIESEEKEYQAAIQELNAQERDAKASVQAVHGQEGGPSRPGSIQQAQSTVGFRAGGIGSGESPAMSGFAGGGPRPGGGPHPGGPGTPPPGA